VFRHAIELFTEVVDLISSYEECFFPDVLLYTCRAVSCISVRPRIAGMEISEFLPWASSMTLFVGLRNA
jgi:hypothetical protein